MLRKKKKKKTYKKNHFQPDGHQPPNNHSNISNIQYTVTANNQQTAKPLRCIKYKNTQQNKQNNKTCLTPSHSIATFQNHA
jgi:hypothetical protein